VLPRPRQHSAELSPRLSPLLTLLPFAIFMHMHMHNARLWVHPLGLSSMTFRTYTPPHVLVCVFQFLCKGLCSVLCAAALYLVMMGVVAVLLDPGNTAPNSLHY
jgi:hypothetical protein